MTPRRRAMLVRTLALAAFALPSAGAAQQQRWIRQFGTSAGEAAHALASDGAGGAFVGGLTAGSLAGASAGLSDAWLGRYDSTGAQLWVRQFGVTSFDDLRAIAPDGAGGAFVAGHTQGSLAAPAAGNWDVFLGRYTSAGDQLWIRQFGSTEHDLARALAPDGAGGAFIAGETGGRLGGPAGFGGAWLARYDSAGHELWLRQFGSSPGADTAFALAPAGAGGAFVAGRTWGDLGGPTAGPPDAWLACYDSAGKQLWSRQLGTGAHDEAFGLASDGADGVFIAGYTAGALGGASAGGADIWLARYDSAGDRLWLRQFGGAGDDAAWALAPDDAGGVYLAGETSSSLGGPAAGLSDAWLARYDGAGNQLWIHQLGTHDRDRALALAPGRGGGAFVAGETAGLLGGATAGGNDVWIARYGDRCYADCDNSGDLTFFDFLCFQNLFATGDPAADCDQSASLDFFDFLCFQNAFAAGCP